MRIDVKKDQEENNIFVEIHCHDITDQVSRLERHIKRFTSYISAVENGEMLNIRLDAILYIESVDKKTFIYTEKRVLITDKRLYELEDMLDKRDFFRCSKNTIIHLNKVIRLKPEINRNIIATLENNENVVISRRYAGELKALLNIEG
ncbi:MAG: LytTR family transcriptional regulator [Eubacterium sp.]|nr:LytTR family transcriptional regulator [Eubacterium sp.]